MTTKKEYYRRADVVKRYDEWRFGSPGGRYVDSQEKGTVLSMLDLFARDVSVLDLPCGTGRLLRSLANRGFRNLVGADSSPAMLQQSAITSPQATLVLADALQTCFTPASFDVICSLRFIFHLPQPQLFFREASRLLKPGGLLVFDSLRWSPRQFCPPLNHCLGGRLFCFREHTLARMLRRNGFTIQRQQRILPFPSQVYRLAGNASWPILSYLQGWLPDWAYTKVILSASMTG